MNEKRADASASLPEYPGALSLQEMRSWDRQEALTQYWHAYSRAWESRCRLAAKDLERFSYFDTNCHGTSFLCTCVGHTARRTLKAIGPLPSEQP
jgi:hypothetical protein